MDDGLEHAARRLRVRRVDALRAGAAIFAADEVIEESGVEFEDGEPDFEQIHVADSDEDVDWGAFRRFLDTVTPDEFALGDDESS